MKAGRTDLLKLHNESVYGKPNYREKWQIDAAVAVLKNAPSLGEHFIIVPLSMVAGALPFTPAGLGTFELAMDQLYQLIPASPCRDGILVALAYRLMTILIAMIGVVYYWASRREVRELLEEAEHEQQALSGEPGTPSHLHPAPDQ